MRVIRFLKGLLWLLIRLPKILYAGLLGLFGWLRAPRRERIVPERETTARAEWTVIVLLFAAAAAGLAFFVFYVVDIPSSTQFLGLALGVCLALIAAALVVAAKKLIPTEHLEESYPGEAREDEEQLLQVIHETPSGLTRRRLIASAGAAAGGALGLSLVAPAASLGPFLDTESLYATPWRAGRRLVDDRERPYLADEIVTGTFYTAYPQGADPEQLGSPIVVVRLDPSQLQLPEGRADWAPDGILAYSKICTHAGCAIGLYRNPLFPQAESKPALVCPCHYSTFDPAEGGTVIFGPAGRNLPQLPLEIDPQGGLRAAGSFSGPVGPSFWGVRTRGPSSS
ncbi:MAG TPA: Rieske 2Fe-2S domain-containing protein [Solirubrobacterales bacterium]|jgi:ubiquinol-cytochrome c reductase iron-sulfur subunit